MANRQASLAEMKETISQANEEALTADGFDAALIGYVEIFNKVVALYDREKCIDILMERDGMARDVAVEFFEFNVIGAWMGESTPAFATIMREVK